MLIGVIARSKKYDRSCCSELNRCACLCLGHRRLDTDSCERCEGAGAGEGRGSYVNGDDRGCV